MLLYELKTPAEVQELENQLDRLMRPVGLDVEFTRHFIERLLGREQHVTIDEVVSSFSKLKQKYKNRLKHAKRAGNYVATLKDFDRDLNIAFKIEVGPNQVPEMKNITIMRKDPNRFGTDNFSKEVLTVGKR